MQIQYLNHLKRYRRMAGYSQKEIAFLFGFTYTTAISKWEKGYILPNMKHLFMLSQLYNAFPNDLYPELWEATKNTVIEKKKSLPKKKKTVQYFYL